jgi:hypothetical protein
MALRYYPLTRIIQNRYTRGNEFTLPDGSYYSGRYYITYDNRAYTGINPLLGTNILLNDVANRQNNAQIDGGPTRSTAAYTGAVYTSTRLNNPNAQLVSLNPYYPVPLPSDYTRGYFTRYFAKTVSGPGFIVEISELDWSKIEDGNVAENALGYEIMDMIWQLTGPLNDTRKSQYQIIGGVFSTNKRVTESKQRGFNGIIEFIGGDYTKFAQITPDIVATTGSI